MECQGCGSSKIENRDLMLCGTCNKMNRKSDKVIVKETQPIKKFSDTRAKEERIYIAKRRKWLKGKTCKLHPDCKGPLTVHHMCGRIGYADEWARENETSYLTDERFWLPVCLEGHQYIEDHPKWAYENQCSFKRITDPIFRV
jgi:hypothetical protein